MSSLNLGTLLSEYEQCEPKRATGGIYALSGFNYQLRLYVAKLAESLASDGSSFENAGNVFLESFSDLAAQKEDKLICIQAKRTLTTSTLKDAAVEILAIDSFLARQHPNLRDQISFKLIASQGDEDITWAKLPKTHPAFSTVKLLLSENRLVQPLFEPDPGWKAISAVWGHLKNPYGFVRFALDRGLNRLVSSDDAQRIRDDICERFSQDRQTSVLSGQLLTSKDFSTSLYPSTSLEIGREITLARMRDQQYMLRPHRRDAVYEQLMVRYDLSLRGLQPAVPVFWLAGRSGVGKSVLLLQAVQRLVLEGRRVLWLGGAAELLEPVLRSVAEAPEDLRPEFIAIDDLYDRDARTRLDLPHLGAFIDEMGNQSWPLVITCGPSEFADTFEEDSRYRGFEVHRETLQLVEADEANEIYEWYRQRTGREPAKGHAFAQAYDSNNGLFISLAVELTHGDLREFSLRFTERVRLNGLDKALYLPLALNRLYLRAPYEWLTQDDREKLNTLNVEGDFKFLESGQQGQFVRLTHPHLGDALYRALRKPGNSEAYANDLVSAFERALKEKNGVLITQLLRMFSAPRQGLTAERLSIVDENHLAEGCARVWQTSESLCLIDPDSITDILTSWACWAELQPIITKYLGDNLFKTAVGSLNDSFKVWTSCWMRLAVCVPKSPELMAWAADHMDKKDFFDHPRWSLVWECCLEHTLDPHIWHKIGLEWLLHHFDRLDWHFVWKKILPTMLDVNWNADSMLLLGLKLLKLENDGPVWAYVLQDLLVFSDGDSDQACELVRLGFQWLTGREERAEWSYVWRALLNKVDQLPSSSITINDLLTNGYFWLQGREDRPEWSYIWQDLLGKSDQLPSSITSNDLLTDGYLWLEGRENQSEWGYVWRALLNKVDQEPSLSITINDLLTNGYFWLQGREDRPEWSYVWRVLLNKDDQLPSSITINDLLTDGYLWLEGRESQSEWGYVWRALLNKVDQEPSLSITINDLLTNGYFWLQGREDRPEWSYIWQDLLGKSDQLPSSVSIGSLLEQGYFWLEGRESQSEWSYVWECLLKADELPASVPVEDLLEGGYCWLEGRENLPDWSFVWQALLSKADQLPSSLPIGDLLVQGSGWLEGRENLAQWGFVWQDLLSKADQLPSSVPIGDLLVQGYGWLEGRENLAQWSFVWQALLSKADELPESVSLQGLLMSGSSWLMTQEDKTEWPVMWWELINIESLDNGNHSFLIALGIQWLSKKGHLTLSSAPKLIEGLLDLGCNDVVFIELVISWLDFALSNWAWPMIATKLLVVAPEHRSSIKIATELTRRIHACPNSVKWHKLKDLVEQLSKQGDRVVVEIQVFCNAFAERVHSPVWDIARQCFVDQVAVQGVVIAVNTKVTFIELEMGLMAFWNRNSDCVEKLGEIRNFYIYQVTPERDYVLVGEVSGKLLGDIKVGDIYEGYVSGKTEYGLFVKIDQISGLLHSSKCADFKQLLEKYPKGSAIKVRVLEKTEKGLQFIWADEETVQPIDKSSICIGDQFDGVVTNVVDYGLFIDIGVLTGLLHREKLKNGINIKSRFTKGQALRVKVISVRKDGKVFFGPVISL